MAVGRASQRFPTAFNAGKPDERKKKGLCCQRRSGTWRLSLGITLTPPVAPPGPQVLTGRSRVYTGHTGLNLSRPLLTRPAGLVHSGESCIGLL